MELDLSRTKLGDAYFLLVNNPLNWGIECLPNGRVIAKTEDDWDSLVMVE